MFGLVKRSIMRAVGLLPRRPVAIGLLAIAFAVLGVLRLLDGGLLALVGAVYLVAAYGLWTMRIWGWWLGFVAAVVGFFGAFGSTLWMVVWAAVLVYLVLVRDSFHPFWERVKRAVA
jgi:uncharacterized membrane protein (DUF2068 family)